MVQHHHKLIKVDRELSMETGLHFSLQKSTLFTNSQRLIHVTVPMYYQDISILYGMVKYCSASLDASHSSLNMLNMVKLVWLYVQGYIVEKSKWQLPNCTIFSIFKTNSCDFMPNTNERYVFNTGIQL